MPLSFEICRHTAGRVVLRLHGDLDRGGAATFHRALSTALEAMPSELLLDLSTVTSIDADGVEVLMAARRAADQLGCRFELSAANPAVDRFLRSPAGTGGLALPCHR